MPTPNIPERDVRSSKPRTLIRMISTKFTPRTVSVPALRSPPAAPRSAFSKEQRDAALRERGLLPPLPNRDLSTQEREQDRHIPIVELGQEESHEREGEGEPSAADLVKKAWEAKNSQPRLPAAAAPPPPPAAAEGAADVNEAAADPRSSLAIKAGQRESAESKRLSDSDMLRPSSLLADLSDEIQAFMFPLPPSLTTSTSKSTSTHKTDADADVSVPPPPSTPAPRLRPPASKADPDPDHETDPSLLRVNNRDSCGGAPTEESHSDASIMTPSLDSTTQTLSSFSHRSSSGVSSASSSVNKKGCLQVRMAGEGQCDEAFSGDELGVVIEEDSVPPSPSLLSKALPAANIKFKLDPAMDKDRAEREANADQDTALLSPVKDSAVKAPLQSQSQSVERKKSMNPFKRAATMSGAHGKDENEDTTAAAVGTQTPTPTPRRRITMASTSFASLSNLRRSVVGTLSKTPASAPMKSRGSTVVDGLPGSPTSPTPTTARAMQMSAGKGEGKPIPRVRQPQQLVMYNRGSILLETAGIEDEETRRMTELAFLG